MKTIKLYDDSHLFEFAAKVISCEKEDDYYKIVLDRTAFFPEGGGQYGDTGSIDEIEITDTQICDGIIYHYAHSPVEINKDVKCILDKEKRFRRMQCHSGEHIVSGLVHKLYGFDNVGFHLGDDVTMDFNGTLNREQLLEIEKLANEAIYKNAKITINYPTKEEIENLSYRSKLDISDDLRIVTVEGYDKCACCAPHCSSTGEIGIIKILDFARHRGGVRVHMLCGLNALEDYQIKYENIYNISVKLCSKQNETASVFEKYMNETNELKQKIAALQKEITKLKSTSFHQTDDNIIIFEDDCDMPNLRNLVLSGVKYTSKICAGFSGNDSDGYIYAMASEKINLREKTKEINTALCGKGGGSAELIQGNCRTSKNEINKFFKEV